MNRNNERHFNQVPETHVSRTRFKRDQNILTTFDAGKLIPFYVDEVLPGDTFSTDTAAIIRMTTPKYPVLDDAFIDFYYFYCPNRILWDNFRHFMGEADETPWMPTQTYRVPKIIVEGNSTEENKKGPKEGSILDYMGVPTKINGKIEINALPIRAYIKIWNEYFRDQNLENQAAYFADDEDTIYNDAGENEKELLKNARTGGRCLPVNKFHDYFTSCLPYPQRGPDVTLPMTGNAQIVWPNDADTMANGDIFKKGTGNLENIPINTDMTIAASRNNNKSGKALVLFGGQKNPSEINYSVVYLGADLGSVTAATINDLRKAVAVQQYYEALARGGSRYREQVQALWDVVISDKTVQVPEYLGGRYPINMSQVVQTSSTTTDSPQGNTAAVSVTPFNENSFTKSFEEHGFIIGVCCVRHDHTYQQGIERMWSRQDALDYYYPQFANLGEQAVKVKEIYTGKELTKENTEEVFGFQEAWSEYRMKPNRVAGKFR